MASSLGAAKDSIGERESELPDNPGDDTVIDYQQTLFFLTIFITIVTITITVRRVGWTKAAPNVALVFTWTVQVIIKMKITIDVDDVRPVF